MTNLKVAMVAGVVVGFALPALTNDALAQFKPGGKPIVLKVNGPSEDDLARTRNGRLRKTDEEMTNEQAVVKFFGDGKKGLKNVSWSPPKRG